MHTRHSVRWLSSVAALSAGLIGLGVPLAAPAAAAANITATPTQPRWAVGTTATVDVTTDVAVTPANLVLNVTDGPDQGLTQAACTALSATHTQWTCTVKNVKGAGTDTVVVTDVTAPKTQSAPAEVSFETIAAAPLQSLYGTGETATISVQVTGAAADNPANIVGSIQAGNPDAPGVANQTFNCAQTGATGVYSCTFTNNGTSGVDHVTIFDDADPSGTPGVKDTTEPAAATFNVNFEQITIVQAPAGNQQPNQTSYTVSLTGVPVAHTPVIKELVLAGQDSAAPGCTAFQRTTATATTGTSVCTLSNGGRADNPTIEVFDDLNNNGTAEATEPSASNNFAFESLSATDTNPPHTPGSTAVVSVSVSGVPVGNTPSIDYTVTTAGDPDMTPASPAVLCNGAGASWTCSITNGGTPGTDTLNIFDDANDNQKQDAGEASTTINITFGTTVTATPASGNYAVSGTAPISAHVNAPATEVPHVRFTVTNGPDAGNAADTSVPCTPLNGGTADWTCNVPNHGAAGLDTVTVYDDTNFQQFGANETAMQAAFANTEPNAVVKANFVTLSSITMTPQLAPGQHSAEVATGGCQVYAVNLSPALSEPVTITITQGLGQAQGGLLGIGATPPGPSLSPCGVAGAPPLTVVSHNETSEGGDPILGLLDPPTYTDNLVLSGTTGQNPANPGQLLFGVSSNTAGTVNVAASSGNLTTGAQALSVVKGGQTAVKILTVTPTSQGVVTGGTATFTVLAQNTNSTPLPGVTVDYVVASGSPDATKAPVACPATSQSGTTTCTLTAGSAIGTDAVTFFAPQGSGETAPASNDPQVSAKVTVGTAPPAGSTLTLNCPDELVTDDNSLVPNCTVTTGNGGQQTVIFAAHVAGPGGAALGDVPVQFTVVSGPASVASTAGNVITNASGNAIFVISETNPASGDKVTVQATVGSPQAGGLGPAVASATFQAPKPTYVTATPATQNVANGGTVNITGKVLDQFGAGVSGQTLDYTVAGRNHTSGVATTGSGGTAAISYVDGGGSGSDVVTVTDVSAGAPTTNNPAQATVTFGAGGCTVNCGGGPTGCTSHCTGAEHPRMHVNQTVLGPHRVRLSLVVLSHPSLANVGVTFYQLRRGVRHKIGSGRTGGHGNVTGTLRAHPGQRLRFQARVAGRGGVTAGFTNVVGVTVR